MAKHAAATATAHPDLQRARGVGRFSIMKANGSRLNRLFQQGSAKVRFPVAEDGVLEAVLINTAGGLAGGDRFSWDVDVAAGAHGRVVTQACEKVYRSRGGSAQVTVSLAVAGGASLEWLPQETILFEGADLTRTFDVGVQPGGRFLSVEATILGRRAMGETGVQARLHDRWRVRVGEDLAFADDLRLDDAPSEARPALLGGAGAFASILMIGGDAEARVNDLRCALGPNSGASAFDGKLFCRILATDGLSLRRRLVAAMAVLRNGRTQPRLWTV